MGNVTVKRKTIPKKTRLKVYEMYNGHCAYCGCEIEYKEMQVDHVESLYWNGGSDEISNYKPACRMCNFYKSTMGIEDFREQYTNKGISLYPVDVKGIEMLKEAVKDAEIVVIYLKCDLDSRYERLYDRYHNGYIAIKRIHHDTEAFKLIECNYVVDTNRALEEVLVDIRGIIKGE